MLYIINSIHLHTRPSIVFPVIQVDWMKFEYKHAPAYGRLHVPWVQSSHPITSFPSGPRISILVMSIYKSGAPQPTLRMLVLVRSGNHMKHRNATDHAKPGHTQLRLATSLGQLSALIPLEWDNGEWFEWFMPDTLQAPLPRKES